MNASLAIVKTYTQGNIYAMTTCLTGFSSSTFTTRFIVTASQTDYLLDIVGHLTQHKETKVEWFSFLSLGCRRCRIVHCDDELQSSLIKWIETKPARRQLWLTLSRLCNDTVPTTEEANKANSEWSSS